MSFLVDAFETSETQLIFALLLRDRLTFADALVGDVTVSAGARPGWRKGSSGTFLFFNLPNGAANLAVHSSADTPYYLPADLTVMIPPGSPLWPAYPDISLADKTLPLWDPRQPAAYRTQFLLACLSPSVAYPFDEAATLVRGTVLHADAPVLGVTVSDTAGNALPYVTGSDGQFVLAFQQPPALPTAITIRAQEPGNPAVDTSVTLRRAAVATLQINL
jgi:hypothetical protein